MSTIFSFDHDAAERNTKCYWLRLFNVRILISYDTPVAFEIWGDRYRQGNHWGPTTRRHLRECGAYDWPIIEDRSEFDRKLDAVIMSRILRDKDLVKQLVSAAVAHQLVPEVA